MRMRAASMDSSALLLSRSAAITSTFYFRWKIGRHFEVTPNLQLLIDPALNPAEDTIWVFGLRAKGSL